MPLILSISAERISNKKFVNFNVNFNELDINCAFVFRKPHNISNISNGFLCFTMSAKTSLRICIVSP